jgi:hypothetical protein
MVEKRMEEELVIKESLHSEEMSFLKRANLQLKRQIEMITATKTYE